VCLLCALNEGMVLALEAPSLGRMEDQGVTSKKEILSTVPWLCDREVIEDRNSQQLLNCGPEPHQSQMWPEYRPSDWTATPQA